MSDDDYSYGKINKETGQQRERAALLHTISKGGLLRKEAYVQKPKEVREKCASLVREAFQEARELVQRPRGQVHSWRNE